MKSLNFVVSTLVVVTGLGFAQASTRSTPHYANDPAADPNYVFGEFEPRKNYADPDFNEALMEPNPLAMAEFDSYRIIVYVNKDNQTARIYDRSAITEESPGLIYYWKVSTAMKGMETPSGYFHPQGFSSSHKSSLYENSPMPWAVFFNVNIATHGTASISRLGRRASHGCVRLEPQRARDLFHLIGLAGEGLVDVIDQSGHQVLDENGLPKQIAAPTTIIIVE